MVSEPLISEPVDPLSGMCGPSLFPRTIRASTDAPFPSDLKHLDSIHHFMKSLGSRSPEKLLEEAKAIVDGGSELLNSNFAAFTASLGIDAAALARGNEKPQERRPGLGRKRAQFSLKPNSSRPSESLEPSLNIDQLQDPEEFFAAVEKLEYAKKEIERQKGGSIPALNENNVSQNIRRRRPGLLGKSVTYKHRYSSVLSENENTFISSQEPLELNVPSAPNCESLQGTDDSDVEPQEIDVAGSISKTENRVNKILNELLSSNSEDLDGDGAVSLLQERLQIKPIELSTLSMPDFHDIGRTDFMALGKNLPKPRRTSLEVQNLVKRTIKETPINHKRVEESPVNSLASPTPPKSPFASISLLKKRILQSNPLRDPFSPLNIDLSTPRNLSSANQVDSNGLKKFNISGELKSLTEDGISKLTVSSRGSEKVITGGSDSLADQSMDKNSSRQSPYVEVRPNGSHSNLGAHHGGYNMDATSTENIENDDLMNELDRTKESVNFSMDDQSMETLKSLTEDGITKPTVSDRGSEKVITGGTDNLADQSMDKNSSRQSPHVDVRPNGSHSNLGAHHGGCNIDGTSTENTENDDLVDGLDRMKENVEDGPRHVQSSLTKHDSADYSTKSASAFNGHGSWQTEKNVEDMPSAAFCAQMDNNIEESTIPDNLNVDQKLFDESHPASTKECTMGMPPTASETESKQETEKLPSMIGQQKRKRSPVGRHERKTLSRRPSIADAGTSFETGVRRSKRIKMRPLEYWKGERFLYGRVNDSLKLIGLKYISPAKGDGKLKVKPFISNEYNELLELAAKH